MACIVNYHMCVAFIIKMKRLMTITLTLRGNNIYVEVYSLPICLLCKWP